MYDGAPGMAVPEAVVGDGGDACAVGVRLGVALHTVADKGVQAGGKEKGAGGGAAVGQGLRQGLGGWVPFTLGAVAG